MHNKAKNLAKTKMDFFLEICCMVLSKLKSTRVDACSTESPKYQIVTWSHLAVLPPRPREGYHKQLVFWVIWPWANMLVHTYFSGWKSLVLFFGMFEISGVIIVPDAFSPRTIQVFWDGKCCSSLACTCWCIDSICVCTCSTESMCMCN